MAYRLAIVGASSLKGQELGAALRDRDFPAVSTLLLEEPLQERQTRGEARKGERRLAEFAEEPALMERPAPEKFEGVDAAFFAGEPAETLKYWKAALDRGALVVDLSGALDLEPSAELAGSELERERGDLHSRLVVIAHPAAQLIARLSRGLSSVGRVDAAVATVFEPVSERGRRGMEELQQQTLNLLSFKPLPTEIYGGQVAFNLRASLGENSRPSLDDVQSRIAHHLELLSNQDGGGLPRPALQVIQAPVFHAHVVSLYAHFAEPVTIDRVNAALDMPQIRRSAEGEGEPDVLRAAGEEQFQVGALRPDASVPNGYWLFATVDNLRVATLNAVDVAYGWLRSHKERRAS